MHRLHLPAVALSALSAFGACPSSAAAQEEKEEQRVERPAPDEDVSARIKEMLHALDPKIVWTDGPGNCQIGDIATMQVPLGVTFTGKEGTKRYLEANENLADGTELATAQSLRLPFWTAYFSYLKSGHVKDDDKHELDASKMLELKQEMCEEGNKERRKRGFSELEVVAWAVPPHYDDASHNLEWGARLRSKEGEVINYEVRCLSRVGQVSALLVCPPEEFEAALEQFRTLIAALSFVPGQRYDEVKPGDPIAEAGLTALIVGGAAALGWKAGIFKYLWKIVIAVGIGVAALWRKITGRAGQAPKPAA